MNHQKTRIQITETALRERIKELSCLYGISKVAQNPDLSLEEVLLEIVKLLPPAWQYPKITCACIKLDQITYTTPELRMGVHKQTAEIVIDTQHRGLVEVIYTEKMPDEAEGPFLNEERNLIDSVAEQVATIIENREAEEEKERLQQQLRHADRLATIGQLASGVAHELNEPLGNILGFAQLALKDSGMPEQPMKDLKKIISASLHAREVIRKLLIFARQAWSERCTINMNRIVEEALYFFEARCAKAGIELIQSLEPGIPEIEGDPLQLNQVLVNLMTNSIQAMTKGGRLSISTSSESETVTLIVEDTGEGMGRDVIQRIFEPFFTTKDVNEGTGLGLSVVHGIVTSHKGTIEVQSKEGEWTRFEIRLPIGKVKERGAV